MTLPPILTTSWTAIPDGRHTKEFNDAFDKQYYALEDERVRCDVMIGGQAVFTQDDIRY